MPVARNPALPLSSDMRNSLRKGIKGLLNPFAILPKILNKILLTFAASKGRT